MINALIGRKDEMFQLFLENGTRIPVTSVAVGANSVLQVKTVDKDRYSAAQLGFGVRTKINKPLGGLVKKAGAKNAPSFIKEVRVS
ncbi:50S ribosomal protein L3, partial [Patescibacteria group bacterium]|nr:50S ribosomal protein L3 [Patescibacteria group bacterium]